MARKSRSSAIMHSLDSSDPRSLDHPCHREQWLELTRALGRSAADVDFDRLHSKKEKPSSVTIRSTDFDQIDWSELVKAIAREIADKHLRSIERKHPSGQSQQDTKD